jgi:hypothetical protein
MQAIKCTPDSNYRRIAPSADMTSARPCVGELSRVRLQKLLEPSAVALLVEIRRVLNSDYGEALTSSICDASPGVLVVPTCGTCQLFTSYHHLRTRLPRVWPLSEALRFQKRQPESARVQTVPWIKGRSTWQQKKRRVSEELYTILTPSIQRLQLDCDGAYLISGSDPRHSTPCLSILDARQVALLEAQIWKRREILTPVNWPNESTFIDKVGGNAVCIRVSAYHDRLFL